MLMPEIKFTEGNESAAEREVTEAVSALKEKFKILEKAVVKKSFRVGRKTIIVTEKDKSGILIGRGGRIAKELSRMLGSTVKVIEEGKETEIAKELASPLNVKGMKIIYSPQKSERYVITFSKNDREKLKSIRNIEKTFKEITGKDIIVAVE